VTLPMMETMGDMYEYITGGTYERDVRLWDEEYGWYTGSGLILMFTARLDRHLDGNGTVEVSTAFNESVTLSNVVSEGMLWLEKPFTNETSHLTLRVRDSVADNYLVIRVYGQVEFV
jgi:hypothetical protein